MTASQINVGAGIVGGGSHLAAFVQSFDAVEGSGCDPLPYTPILACNAKQNTRTHASSSMTRHSCGSRGRSGVVSGGMSTRIICLNPTFTPELFGMAPIA